jgi:predicted transcriptional regulator
MGYKIISVRVTDALHKALKDMAERTDRSLNGMVVFYVKQGLRADGNIDTVNDDGDQEDQISQQTRKIL